MVWLSSRSIAAATACALLAGCGAPSPATLPARQTAISSPTSVRPAADAQTAASGTLYAAESHVVHAYPLDADGATAATRTIVPHPNEDQYIQGLAVNADGTLDILEQYYAGGVEAAGSEYCRVVVEPASANGAARAVGTHLCGDSAPTVASNGIARNTFGGYDVLYIDANGRVTLRRFGSDGASVISSLWMNTSPEWVGTDRAGHDYLTSSDGLHGRIQMYKPTTTDYAQTKWDITFIYHDFGAIAVSPGADRTIYLASGPYIDVLTPFATDMSALIGPFNSHNISSMAVDAEGLLYVAFWPKSGPPGSVIRVYAAGASGKPAPLRVIVPSPPILGPITGLAIAN